MTNIIVATHTASLRLVARFAGAHVDEPMDTQLYHAVLHEVRMIIEEHYYNETPSDEIETDLISWLLTEFLDEITPAIASFLDRYEVVSLYPTNLEGGLIVVLAPIHTEVSPHD